MNLMTNDNPLLLWRETIQVAEQKCAVTLNEELEAYLVTLLNTYTDKPELTKKVLGKALLSANQTEKHERHHSLREVGDHCLLFAGLFPHQAERKMVRVSYFVNLGRSAYALISNETNDLFGHLAYEFVVLMDVLQSIRPDHHLLPLDAYEQWRELGSKRALQILQEYTKNRII